MDLLQAHLTRARASGGVFARTLATPPWGLRLSGTIQLAVHAVVQGRAWLWLDDPDAPLELAPGDVALVRGGPDHHIAHEPAAMCLSPEQFRARHAGDEPSGDRRASVFLCGAYRFSGDVGRRLLRALPPVLPLSSAPGHQTVLDRLLAGLLVRAIRACFQRSPKTPCWYRPTADPRLSPALSA